MISVFRKRIVILPVLSLLILCLAACSSKKEDTFRDVVGDAWYADTVAKAAAMGLIDGYKNGSFAPDGMLTMQECVKIAACVHQYREEGEVTLSGKGWRWYEPYYEYAQEHGLISFSSEMRKEEATRADVAKIFSAILDDEDEIINEITRHFCDVQNDIMWYYDSAYRMYQYGIMIGDDEGCFYPGDSIPRREAVTAAVRMADASARVKGEIAIRKEVDLPVLMYHNFDEKMQDYTTSVEAFRSHLDMFQKNLFTTITFEDLLRYIDGEENLPFKPILLVSDDGYMGVLTHALPLLEEYDMKMSVAVVGNLIGERGTWKLTHFFLEEEAAADTSGRIELVSHSYGMHDMTEEMNGADNLTLSAAQYAERVKGDCDKMKSIAGDAHPMMTQVFIYPFGACDEDSEAELRANGHRATVTTEWGIARVCTGVEPDRLPRINAEWIETGDDLLERMAYTLYVQQEEEKKAEEDK